MASEGANGGTSDDGWNGATGEASGGAKPVSTRATAIRDFAAAPPRAYTHRPVNTTAPEKETRYGFGANWRSFVATALNDTRVAHAVASVQQFLSVEDLRGRTFLDIGCGSGLFSLAAHLLGAERVV
jgi:hypothetical protein